MHLIFPTILVVTFFAIVLMMYKQRKVSQRPADSASEAEERENRGLKFKRGFKLMSYREALEASKQFIYEITRLVLQKFTPSDKNSLLEAGRRLFNSGVQYMHVVDVLSLSLQKQSQISGPGKDVKKDATSGISK